MKSLLNRITWLYSELSKVNVWKFAMSVTAIFLLVLQLLIFVNLQVMKAELIAPKVVQLKSNGQIHEWPVDNYNVRVVNDD